MKQYKTGLLLVAILITIVVACSKKTTGSSRPTLILSKSTVKLGEPLVVTTKGQAAGSSVQWSASPNTDIWTSASGDTATFLFTRAGNFQVSAAYQSSPTATAYDSTSSPVTVNDSIYSDSGTAHCDLVSSVPVAAGDQVILTPISYSDSAGLVLLAHTKNSYDFFPALVYGGNFSGSGGGLECDFTSITEYPCNGYDLPTPALTDVFFNSLANGTYNLVFKLNGTSYQGSMTLTSTTCTFNWGYASGVTISPLQIQKL